MILTPDGVSLATDIGGPPDAPTVILMHGGGQTRHSWSGAMLALVAAGYRVINYDARGHGESDWSPGGIYSPDIRSLDLLTVIGHTTGPVALVGASMGGATAMHTISGGLVPAALILVDIVARPEALGIARILAFMKGHLDGFATLDEAADAVAAYNPDRPRPTSTGGLRRNLREAADGRLHWHWDPRFLPDDPERDRAALALSVDGVARVQGLPTLLIRGVQSDVVTDASVADFRASLPQLEVLDVAGAGHMVAGDKNDAFNAGVLGYLARHLPV